MADEEAPGVPVEAPGPVPAPEAEPDQTITLLDHTHVLGELRPKGKVLVTSAAEAERLVGAGLARLATDFDRRIGGVN